MQHLDTEKAQAVLFFGEDGIEKELLYAEFEALLDGYVPISEWASQTRKAVYVEINCDLMAEAAVFFTLSFDSKGSVDPSWNLPLFDMARTVSKGPDLGAGPIHLACHSQCPIAYFQDWMWDPNMKTVGSHFGQIKRALKRNRLGVQFKPEGDELEPGAWSETDVKKIETRLSQKLTKQYDRDLRNQMAQLLKDQRLLTLTMVKEKDEAVKEVQTSLTLNIETLQQRIEEKDLQLTDSLRRNDELKETIDGQVQKIDGLREYFEHKLRRLKNGDKESIDTIVEQHKIEVDTQISAATRDLSDRIKMKDVELSYRVEHEENLKGEVDALRESNKELLENSGDHLLEKLSRKGVNFVTYQPGAGHITIPLSEIARFVESPSGFTADYCGISEKHYLAWLKHYQTPVCTVTLPDSDMCCENIPRVVVPAEFLVGDSDCCAQHKLLNNPLSRRVI